MSHILPGKQDKLQKPECQSHQVAGTGDGGLRITTHTKLGNVRITKLMLEGKQSLKMSG